MKQGNLGLHNETRHTPHYRCGRLQIQSKFWITIISALLVQPLLADTKWVRLETPGLEVLSGAGSSTGREVLRRFGQIRHVIETRAGTKNLTPMPVRVIVFPSVATFEPYRVTDSAVGYYASGTDRDYIVMRADAADLYRVIFHEYVHLALHRAGAEAPTWFDEGTAEVYSNAQAGAHEVLIGRPIPSHVATLKLHPLMKLDQLFGVTHTSPEYNERDRTGMLYAQSWALVHMLNFAREYKPGMPRFVQLLLSGTESATAIREAFGKTTDQVGADLAMYIRADAYESFRLPASPLQTPVSAVTSMPLSTTDTDMVLADLLLAIHRPDEAEKFLERAARQRSNQPEYAIALGDVALQRKQDEVARRHYERAIALGSKSARLRLDYALVLRELNAPDAEIAAALREALSLDPNLQQARELLQSAELRMNQQRLSVAAKPLPPKPQNRVIARAEGVLTRVDCLGTRARLVLTPHLFLLVTDPANVELRNAGGVTAELTCGEVNRPVAVEYKPAVNTTYGTAGEVSAIEFR